MEEKTAVTAPAEAKKAENEVLTLDSLIKFGVFEKECEPIQGLKIRMHPLLQEEREEASKLMILSPEVSTSSMYAASESEKVPTLVYAISEMGGEKFETPEQKKILFEKLRKIPGVTLDLLYLTYSKLSTEQLSIIMQGIKKK